MRIRFLGGLWLLVIGSVAGAAGGDESLNYRVHYEGLLSGMTRVAIADVSLYSTATPELQVHTLHLSSAGYGMVDALYPIRYRLRSLYHLSGKQLLAFERYKRGRKFKHDLAWVDAEHSRVRYLRADHKGQAAELPRMARPWISEAPFVPVADTPSPVAPGVLDRLILLQVVRQQVPATGKILTFSLTDGRKRYRYQVEWLGADRLELDGRGQQAWQLRVHGQEIDGNGNAVGEAAHAPIELWLSADSQRLPLRLQIDHAVGSFTVDLARDAPPVRVAVEPPPQPQVAAAWD
jgi:hypothetical protein